MNNAKAQERIDELDNSGIAFGEPMVRLDDHSKALQAMQGLADALRSARNAIEFSQRMGVPPACSLELYDAALRAAEPFLRHER